MREARSTQAPVDKRAADHLQAAATTVPLLGTGAQQTPAIQTDNAACGESDCSARAPAKECQLWNSHHPLTLTM